MPIYEFKSDSDSEFKFKSDSEFKSEFKSEYESEYISDTTEEENALSLPAQDYSKEIYNLWIRAGYPIEKDLFQFQCGAFKRSLSNLKGINSKDVIQAVKNYIKVQKSPLYYITNEYTFDKFVSIPSFKDFLPGNFRVKNYLIKKASGPSSDSSANERISVEEYKQIVANEKIENFDYSFLKDSGFSEKDIAELKAKVEKEAVEKKAANQ